MPGPSCKFSSLGIILITNSRSTCSILGGELGSAVGKSKRLLIIAHSDEDLDRYPFPKAKAAGEWAARATTDWSRARSGPLKKVP